MAAGLAATTGIFLWAVTADAPVRYGIVGCSVVVMFECAFAPRVVVEAKANRSWILPVFLSLGSVLLAIVPILLGLLVVAQAAAGADDASAFAGCTMVVLGILFSLPALVTISTVRAVRWRSPILRAGMLPAIDRATSANDRWLELSSQPAQDRDMGLHGGPLHR